MFIIKGETLRTPSTLGPLVPGVMRGLVLQLARDLPLDVQDQGILTKRDISEADEVFLTNSVRGLIPVSRVYDPLLSRARRGPSPWTWFAPGPWTQRLSITVTDWLERGGEPS